MHDTDERRLVPAAAGTPAPSPEPGEPAERAMRQVEREMVSLLRRVRRSAAEHAHKIHPDLLASGYAVLMMVAENEPARSTAVAQALDLDKGMVSRQVTHLEALGLVTRESDPQDRRAQLLRLTDGGRARVTALRQGQRSSFESRLREWPLADLQRFAADLERYNSCFERPEP